MGNGASDGEPVSQAVLAKQPAAQVVVPSHKTAVFSVSGMTQRNQHIETIAQKEPEFWQQKTEAWISASALNRMTNFGIPISVKI